MFRAWRHFTGNSGFHWGIIVAALFLAMFLSNRLSAEEASPKLDPPSWLTHTKLSSDDGFAVLEWSAGQQVQEVFFRLSESHSGGESSSYVEGTQTRIYRAQSGDYSFALQQCQRGEDGYPHCGKKSKKLTLTVAGSLERDVFATRDESATLQLRDSVDGGPDQLSPGLWFNPERSGHGFSFYWANRLALPETNESHGYSYDLVGVWYTYEAKSRFIQDRRNCLRRSSGCTWVYEDYRPLVARLKLIKDGPSRYSGGVYAVRNGLEILEGSASITFGSDNRNAVVDWDMNFKLQRLSGSDALTLAAGAEPSETQNVTHFSGIWEPAAGPEIQVIDNIGSYSEAVNVLFQDSEGDPTWIQAVNEGVASSNQTSLCFYFVASGYSPASTGTLQYKDSGCSTAIPAGKSNRNGLRFFTGFETAKIWASFVLPYQMGEVQLGSDSAPHVLSKTASFHRIFYRLPEGSCSIGAGHADCPVELTWFTDGDYPGASVFSFNKTSGSRRLLSGSDEPATVGHTVFLDAAGAYEFELRMGGTASSSLIARSAELLVKEEKIAVPSGVSAHWLDQAAGRFEVAWDDYEGAATDRFELEMTDPAGAVSHHSVPWGGPNSMVFNFPSGPFGNYLFRVRACRDQDCSDWSDSLAWLVPEPGGNAGDILHPWASVAGDQGLLIKNLAMHYAMGYHFRPEKDGYIKELGGLFNGAKMVRLFERSSQEMLAEALVSSDNQFRFAAIEPVAVQAGTEYTVAVYLQGSGGSYFDKSELPLSLPNITLLGSTYVSTGSDPNAIPVNSSSKPVWGQADIGFVTAELPPGGGSEATPEIPPPPAGKPDFSILLQSAPAKGNSSSTKGAPPTTGFPS